MFPIRSNPIKTIRTIDIGLNTIYENKFIDFADATINNVYQGAYYKIVSLGVAQEGGTARALMYSKVADGEWKMASFDKTADDPCKDATDEDKAALQTIGLCELVEEQSE